MSKEKSQLHGIGYPPPRGTPEEREREKAKIYRQGLLTPQSRQNHLLCCSVSETFPSSFLSASFLHLHGRHLRTTDPGCYVGGARVATYPLVCGEKTQVRSYDWCTATILVFTQIPDTVQKKLGKAEIANADGFYYYYYYNEEAMDARHLHFSSL